MRKAIFILFILFSTNNIFSQEFNGVYSTDFTNFVSKENPSKNFSNPDKSIISIDIYDYPKPSGSVTLTIRQNGESANIKFVLTGEKEVGYEDGTTYITYQAYIYLLNQKTQTKCTVAVDSNLTTFIVLYENGSTQTWNLKKM